MNNFTQTHKPLFFIDFENTSAETHEKILAALQAELDEAKAENRIPIWDKGLERLSNCFHANIAQ